MTIRLFFNHATLPSIFYIGDSVLQMIISVVVALTVCLVGIWLLQNYINKRNKEGNNE
jgi:flagellar biogenesis protein FliO